jgi:Molybdopterin-binding domain of aldehyde dehydrogenase
MIEACLSKIDKSLDAVQAAVAVPDEGGAMTVHPAMQLELATEHLVIMKSQVDAVQAAVAVPDEGGAMTVHSATQSVDAVQRAVAATLGTPFHQVPHETLTLSTEFEPRSR